MTRKQLIKLLSYHYENLPLHVIQKCTDIIINQLITGFKDSRRIEIRGFGSFTTKLHKGKIVRHPSSRKLIKLKEHKVVHYKTGKSLYEALNQKIH